MFLYSNLRSYVYSQVLFLGFLLYYLFKPRNDSDDVNLAEERYRPTKNKVHVIIC